jgi:chemotaxis protein CheX
LPFTRATALEGVTMSAAAAAAASNTPAPNAPPINVKLIVPFVNSVRAVFAAMIKIPTTVQRPHLKMDASTPYDVTSIIGFSGDVVGSVVVSMHLQTAARIVSSFAGTEIAPNTPDYADAIGEIANMIAGCAKKDLGKAASITVPTVVFGNGHCIARLSDVPTVVIPVATPVGDFVVEVNVKQLDANS